MQDDFNKSLWSDEEDERLIICCEGLIKIKGGAAGQATYGEVEIFFNTDLEPGEYRSINQIRSRWLLIRGHSKHEVCRRAQAQAKAKAEKEAWCRAAVNFGSVHFNVSELLKPDVKGCPLEAKTLFNIKNMVKSIFVT